MSRKRTKKARPHLGPTRKVGTAFVAVVGDNKWQLVAFAGTLLIAGLGWSLATCITDTRESVRQFRQEYLTYKAADERYLQDFDTLNLEIASYISYLDQDSVQLDRILRHEARIVSLAAISQDGCNSSKNAFYKFKASEAQVARYYDFEKWEYVLDTTHKCALLSNLAGGVSFGDSQRLAADKKYRKEGVARVKPIIANSQNWFSEVYPQQLREANEAMEYSLRQMDARNSTVLSSCWDCLVTALGGRKKLP